MKTKRLRKVLALALTLMISSLGLTSAFSLDRNSVQENQAPDVIEKIEGRAAPAIAPEKYRPVYSSVPPDVRPNHLDSFAMEEEEELIKDPNPNHPVAPPDLSKQTKLSDAPLADNTLTIFQNSNLVLGSVSSVIGEPAHAANGKNVFFTGNWYAARSTNAGASFTYVNPYADFPDFCCDQDVVQDQARNLIIWFRQGVKDNTGVNRLKIATSTNGGATFAVYTFLPTGFDTTLTGQWLDYPHLATSNNFFYMTINIFNGAGAGTGKLLIRIPLSELAAAATVHPIVWKETTGTVWTPVQGARETMYLGSPFSSAGSFKVYTQTESTTTLTNVTKTVPAWTFTTRNGAHCLTPNGRNPCGRTDQRLNAGWVAKGVIGFFWNVKEGGGFPYPYINAATFRESDKTVLGRPYIFNTGYAFQYGAAAPNARGDIGIACFVEGGSQGYPRLTVGLDDDYTAGSAWALSIVASSTNWGLDGGGQEGSGDYLRVRAHNPAQNIWTASGYIGTGSPVSYVGKYVVFGRERETRSWNRWKLL